MNQVSRSTLLSMLELVLTACGVIWLVALVLFGSHAAWLLVAWNVAALVYIATIWFVLYQRIPSDEAAESTLQAPRWQSSFFAAVVSVGFPRKNGHG
ncbi:hypothetical protein [Gordonia sp. i37]|uniref:hypothetical protein n=1 Tax=Gordonia sp. i37 TaxID=1961707 RepID=UPI0009AEE0E0|nr:hypothetical protein [Gordonia sp. i37]OPX06530.1 hypothetical protein B1964_28585 [Gordonia sp. i37]